MKKLIAVAVTTLMLSSGAFASTNTHTIHHETKIHSAGYATKSQAYDAGFDIVDEIKTASVSELRHKLPISNDKLSNMQVEEVEVELEEYSIDRGKIQYRAVVDVNYSYEQKSDS